MLFVFVYLIVGIVLTGMVDYIEHKRGDPMSTLSVVISVLGWPFFLVDTIIDKIKN